ncbi:MULTISPECIES: AAA family ATPase [Sphingobacterium]|uniref:AAA family ATPase n=1 Tax=Sphingobacterium TaxID=28453 RepID=UPI0025809A6C|nr:MULTISPECIES: AAA family ATPase [Sphingobacterium]
MENTLKAQIVDALASYMEAHKLTQSQVAKSTEINAAYLTAIRKHKYFMHVGGKNVDIADKYFHRIAKYVGFEVDKQYWERRKTPQMNELYTEIILAKDNGEPIVYVNETGAGKTYTLDFIQTLHPEDFFVIKASESDHMRDIIDKICEVLGIEKRTRSTSGRLREISRELRKLRERGFKPSLIFDEAEYFKFKTLCMFKELYDHLNGLVSLGLVGTDQLVENIETMVMKNLPGMPQFYRRVKFKIRRGIRIDRRYEIFLQDKTPEIQKWLRQNCDNYGELSDVVTTVWREADKLNQQVSVEFIETVLGITGKRLSVR